MSRKKSYICSSSSGDPHHVGVPDQGGAEGPERPILKVDSLAAGGRGVARDDAGRVWFLPGTVPGDRVQARIRKARNRFVEGAVVEFLDRSELRREAPCPLQKRCGGCPWMVLAESDQRDWKRRILADALTRLGRFAGPAPDPVAVVSERLGYRNKVEFSLGLNSKGMPAVGLHAAGGEAGLVDVEACPVQHASADAVLSSVRAFLLDPERLRTTRWPGRDETRLVLRRSWANGQLLVALRTTTGAFPHAVELAEHLASRHPDLRGVVRITTRSHRRGGSRIENLWGRSHITERVGGQKFRLPAATFLQINAEAANELVRRVTQAARPFRNQSVLDLYGGVGSYAFALLRAGAGRALVCDADRDAIDCGSLSARDSKIRTIRFVHSDAGAFLRERIARGARFDVVVANPPRTGMGRGGIQGILGLRPSRIVVVSCDPATLARDLRGLVDGGFTLERVTPVDMFPQTAHIEAIAVLSRS